MSSADVLTAHVLTAHVLTAHVVFVADFSEIGGGYGGYNQDHEFFGYRQSI